MPLFKRITAPAVTPISLEEAKANMRVTVTDQDALITGLIAAATEYLDGRSGILGQAMVTQTWEMNLDFFPSREIEIPFGPVQSITSVKYDDADGAEQTVGTDDYYSDLISNPAWVIPKTTFTWPAVLVAANAVRVQFVVGFGVAADVPAPLRHAIHLLVAHWYENREAVTVGNVNAAALPMGVDALVSPFRRVRF